MNLGVVDAGVVIGWMQRRHRSFAKLERLFVACRGGETALVISAVNLAEVLLHTAHLSRVSGVDPVALLRAWGVRVHSPDEAIARRVAKLPTSLGDGFAAATARELGARFHTTDAELVRQIRGTGLAVTRY
ncbi:MAG TPA: PIN domain-containing protein [Methylomirabilota bacterium]|nr:PIN domain-containing protein [Methylomirabilota bacterium]